MGKIRSKILNIISEEFSIRENEITDEIGPGDLAKWDSIGQLRLIMELEKQFKIQLSVDDVMSINNMGDINKVITRVIKGEERRSAVPNQSMFGY